MERVRYYLGLLVKIKQVTERPLRLKPSGRKSLDIQNHFSYCTLGYFIFIKYSCVSWTSVPPLIHVGGSGSLWHVDFSMCASVRVLAENIFLDLIKTCLKQSDLLARLCQQVGVNDNQFKPLHQRQIKPLTWYENSEWRERGVIGWQQSMFERPTEKIQE